jgi:hypothetical protein
MMQGLARRMHDPPAWLGPHQAGENFFIWDGFEAKHPQMLAELGLEGKWRTWTFTLTEVQATEFKFNRLRKEKAPHPVKGIKPTEAQGPPGGDRRITGAGG